LGSYRNSVCGRRRLCYQLSVSYFPFPSAYSPRHEQRLNTSIASSSGLLHSLEKRLRSRPAEAVVVSPEDGRDLSTGVAAAVEAARGTTKTSECWEWGSTAEGRRSVGKEGVDTYARGVLLEGEERSGIGNGNVSERERRMRRRGMGDRKERAGERVVVGEGSWRRRRRARRWGGQWKNTTNRRVVAPGRSERRIRRVLRHDESL
jgi:hypothetical protein